MNRAFLSLYLVIVFSVLAIGWGTERVWQAYSEHKNKLELSLDRKELLAVIVQQLQSLDSQQIALFITDINAVISGKLELLAWDDLAESAIKQSLRRGDLVLIDKNKNEQIYYAVAKQNNSVLMLRESQSVRDEAWVYRFLIIIFYALLAVAIYFWVYPLTRDLKRLQDSAESVGRDGKFEALSLKPSSAVYSLARSFDQMAARIRELLASRKEMTHGMSHELRTPLARMKFTLASVEKDDTHTEIWSALNDNVHELESLVNQFLNYASFEANNQKLEYRQGELPAMVERIIEHGHYSLAVQIENRLRYDSVWCDWDLIEHCVKNLMQNADRYGNTAMLVELSENDNDYVICVHDDGEGVELLERERIFEAFYRSKTPSLAHNSDERGGFGLGLALVKRIIAWHQGSISVGDSNLGGACFKLAWPKKVSISG